jgi:hypothetical protein
MGIDIDFDAMEHFNLCISQPSVSCLGVKFIFYPESCFPLCRFSRCNQQYAVSGMTTSLRVPLIMPSLPLAHWTALAIDPQ